MSDENVTAQRPALSPALRAQVRDEELADIMNIIRREAIFFNQSGKDAADRILRLLRERRASKILFDQPRGLSASEAPGAAAVTPNPPEVS